MIQLKKDEPQDCVIDLDGPDGNAFVLLGIASKFMNQIDRDRKQEVLDEMRNLDYKNLIFIFEREFGSFVTLKTSNPELVEILV